MYEHNHRKEMPVDAIAQLLSQMLVLFHFAQHFLSSFSL
jgi:hypothetical protein